MQKFNKDIPKNNRQLLKNKLSERRSLIIQKWDELQKELKTEKKYYKKKQN
ncbi:hypothetical protein [Aquibacillus albus]|uniref:FbpB family small basic protein n=1 Tax=Aquibacillus albus TaxID=1168171 RepID=A0ABS2N3L1_9BACI|nr:hypothetical protein [Aquibacillus albus]MBM7572688.1 hypothetical protein [Aquibacillus albus]